MHVIQGRVRDYAWGARDVIPNFFGMAQGNFPVAELWFGAHAAAPARCEVGNQALALAAADTRDIGAARACQSDLRQYVASDPVGILGRDVARRGEGQLPFLLKLIAPAQPLSLQVHPSIEQARVGFAREDRQGIALDAPNRSYKDANHKPELVYAFTRFEALVGFRSPRRIIGVLEGLGAPLADELAAVIRCEPDARGVRRAFSSLLLEGTRPSESAVAEVVAACAARPPEDSPSQRADSIVGTLASYYPGDPGVVASLLLNPVTLKPGEAMFTPAGTVHAYLSGFGMEIMANSDNVLRAGLTSKYVDVPELIDVMETVAAPPIRIAPERISHVQSTYYAPVDDFELSIIDLRDASARVKLRGGGPRIILALAGAAEIRTASGQYCLLNTGQAAFLRADDGVAHVRGAGRLVQADVP
ncbi:mannose-6-phosphate isomerase, class I [Trueperella pecoris]|uniref:mannose-6-phosphate isomerase, class I n=1 Tax=Trueperella pecoris TaxID=2733571 RepID=UPI00186B969A|nr:mannose-6-phosphate isomerase, class I [Trueperella pecoris]QOQ38093.1 mannose-6-phosphate isomerase, class I [Trueperella pecoris]QTG75300.1 mannose-6-phosphate isomerase, class I [Trueperella pecoris]